MAEIYKPPTKVPYHRKNLKPAVFLAGSIEMGEAEDWQARMATILTKANINVLNPRRDDWDSSWEQDISDDNFREQVLWELEGLEKADAVLIYFAPETKAPISLLELGLLSQRKPAMTFIVCPKGFWRRGNVQVVAMKYGMIGRFYETLDEAVGAVIGALTRPQKFEDAVEAK